MMGDNDKEIFERLRSIEMCVTRIETSVTHIMPRCTDHEQRLRALEDDAAKRKGVMAAVGALGGSIGAGLMWLAKAIFQGQN